MAAKLKADKKAGKEIKTLVGKNFALIFEKDSTRTRCAFEVGAADQGAHTTYLGPTGSQMNKKESLKDTVMRLGLFIKQIIDELRKVVTPTSKELFFWALEIGRAHV